MPKILAIDDINDNLISLKAIIDDTFPDAVVFTALNGQKGIELALANNPDVILLDVIMPGMDGFEVCRLLKLDEQVRDIPVVFLTALKGDKENRIKALEVGAEGFLSKPIDETELTAQIRAMLKIKAANEQKRNEKARLVKLVDEQTRELQNELDERKKTEEALKESEERFRDIFNISPDSVAISEVETGKYVMVNSSFEMLCGFKKEEIIGKTSFELGFWLDINQRKIYVDTLKTDGEVNNLELTFIKKDGSLIHTLASSRIISSAGKLLMLNVIKDITDRIRAEELLRESEYFFKESQRAAFVGSYKFDLVTDFWTSSEILEQIFGIDKSYNRSLKGWQEIVHPDDREMMLEYFNEEVVSKRNPFNKEYRITRKSDSETRWVLGLGKLNFDADDKVIEMIGTIQDITERKNSEELLRNTNELNNTLLKTIPFGMDIVDEQGNILFQSENMKNVFSRTAIGCKCWDLYRDDKIQCLNCPLLSGIEIGKTDIYESSGVLGGRTFQISHTGLMFKGKKAMLEIFQDITESKEAEIALKESEERYRRFISQVSEGVYRFESDEPMDTSLPLEEQIDFMYDHLTIAECNDAFLKMYGITNQEEMIGKTFIDLHGGRDNERNRDVQRKFVENNYHLKETVTEELNAKGQKMYISNTSIGILENNKLIRVWGTQSDISSRIRADQVQQVLYSISNAALSAIDLTELIEFISNQLSKLLDSSNFFIAFYDESTNMLSTIFEKDEKDVLQTWSAEKSATGYVIKNEKSLLLKEPEVKKMIESGEIEIYGTLSKVWLGVPLFVGKKVIGAIVVQSYDSQDAYTESDQLMLEFISHQISISIERKKAEQELKDALIKAQESDRLKSAFLANMSHEIRTPLNSIIGFSELMTDPEFDFSEQFDFAKMINASGTNLLAIINDIMDISKIETGQVQIKIADFTVDHLIADIQKEYSFNASMKGVELILDPANPEDEIVLGSDENKIRQVLVNLVGNAIKFTKDGLVEIGVRNIGEFVQFHVKDTGIGIPKEYHHQIFERFRQVESADTRRYGGNGLGLAISKSLVELLGGKIWMESGQGKGSTFYFTIPIH